MQIGELAQCGLESMWASDDVPLLIHSTALLLPSPPLPDHYPLHKITHISLFKVLYSILQSACHTVNVL